MAWLGQPEPSLGQLPRGLAMVDPLSRRAAWLREPAWDRRHAMPRFSDYADFVRRSGTTVLSRSVLDRR